MSDFILPVATRSVSDNFDAHRNRTPPSVNPGTDFTTSIGSPVTAPADGVVADIDSDNGGSGGRMLGFDCDNGYGFDFLHLSDNFPVATGTHVAQGTVIAYTGASAYGSDSGVASHCHVAVRPNHRHYVNAGNVDFEALLDGRSGVSASGGSGGVSINALLGSDYVSKLQQQLGVTVDGDAGPQTTRALQSKIGTEPDGDFGPNSVRALQAFVGAGVDGDWGPQTTAATKAAIDAGQFGGATPTAAPDGHPYPGLTEWGTSGTGITVQYQRRLIELGYSVGPYGADDDHGAGTTEGLSAFQRDLGLTVDGVGGRETWAALWAERPPTVPAPTVSAAAAPASDQTTQVVPVAPVVETPTVPKKPSHRDDVAAAELAAALEVQAALGSKIQVNDLGSVITDPTARKWVWAVWSTIGLVLAALIGGYTAIRVEVPDWVLFAGGMNLAIQPAFGSLAMANIRRKVK